MQIARAEFLWTSAIPAEDPIALERAEVVERDAGTQFLRAEMVGADARPLLGGRTIRESGVTSKTQMPCRSASTRLVVVVRFIFSSSFFASAMLLHSSRIRR